MTRTFILLACLLAPLGARADIYAETCADTVTDPRCVGQAVGTTIERVPWDGATPFAPPGIILVPYTNQTVVIPAYVPGPTMTFAVFYARLTPTQRKGLWSKMVSDTTLADDWWAFVGDVAGNGGIVDVTHPQIIALGNWCVTQSYLTAPQEAALLALQ
jgi:hypothetical protein